MRSLNKIVSFPAERSWLYYSKYPENVYGMQISRQRTCFCICFCSPKLRKPDCFVLSKVFLRVHETCILVSKEKKILIKFPGGWDGKESTCECRRLRFDPWRSPGKGNGNPLQYCLENSMSLVDCNLWGHEESDMTERLTLLLIGKQQVVMKVWVQWCLTFRTSTVAVWAVRKWPLQGLCLGEGHLPAVPA